MTLDENHPPAPDVAPKERPIGIRERFFKNTETVLLLILAMFGLALAWGNSANDVGVDFYQFWVVGQSVNHPGINNVYSDDARQLLGAEFFEKAQSVGNPRQTTAAKYRQKLETYSSPFLYVLFGLFSTGNYETDFRNYRLLMLACLAAGIVILCRLLNHSPGSTLGAIAIFSAWFEPFASDLRVGNVNSLQLAALAVYLWAVMRMQWCYRDVLGGALIGLMVAFKPNLVFVAGMLAVYWIVSRQIRRLWFHSIGAVVGVAVAISFAAASFRSLHCWTDWLSALHSLPGAIITVDLGNFSPAQILNESFGINIEIPLAIIFGGLAVAVMWIRQRNVSRERGAMPAPDEFPEMFAVSIGCLLVVLMARLAWLHYYVLTIPAFLFLLRPAGVSSSAAGFIARRFLTVLALLAFATGPILCIGIPLTARGQGVLAVCAALLLFFALAIFSRCGKTPATGTTDG
jgi:hypothetical protein